jgi:hypothetical protein
VKLWTLAPTPLILPLKPILTLKPLILPLKPSILPPKHLILPRIALSLSPSLVHTAEIRTRGRGLVVALGKGIWVRLRPRVSRDGANKQTAYCGAEHIPSLDEKR